MASRRYSSASCWSISFQRVSSPSMGRERGGSGGASSLMRSTTSSTTRPTRSAGAVPYWVVARSEQCGVRSSYADPARLGADRWAALIGARHLYQGACVVVNAGTTMTVDALSSESIFLGGCIVPGFELMRRALAANITEGVHALDTKLHDAGSFIAHQADLDGDGHQDLLLGGMSNRMGHYPALAAVRLTPAEAAASAGSLKRATSRPVGT